MLANKRPAAARAQAREHPPVRAGRLPALACALLLLAAACATQRRAGVQARRRPGDRHPRRSTPTPTSTWRGRCCTRRRSAARTPSPSCERALNFDRDAPELHAHLAEIYLQPGSSWRTPPRRSRPRWRWARPSDGLVADAHLRAAPRRSGAARWPRCERAAAAGQLHRGRRRQADQRLPRAGRRRSWWPWTSSGRAPRLRDAGRRAARVD